MNNKKLRVGIVGGNPERGWAKTAHIPALQAIDGAEITAVSARTIEVAEAAAQQFNAGQAFDDSLELTRSPNVDVVAVTVKVPEHRAIVLSALQAGKHVYCEWPLGRDLVESREMAVAARAGGVHAAVGLQGLASPAVRRAIELVDGGAIGDLQLMRAFSPTGGWASKAPDFYAYLNDRRNGATLATITGGHTLAVITRLAGCYAELEARASILNPRVPIIGSDEVIERTCADHIVVTGRHESGCVSLLEVAGGQSTKARFRMELTGTRGRITMSSDHPGDFQTGSLRLWLNGEEIETSSSRFPSLEAAPLNVAELYHLLLEDVRTGSRRVPDFDAAERLSALLQSIDEASDSGVRHVLPF